MTEYRYRLTRDLGRLDLIDVPLCWVMLNPSTADETADDPTIRRVKAFTAAAGYGRLIVVNLFALRSTTPKGLREHPDPVGPDNLAAVQEAMAESARVVLAWGGSSPLPKPFDPYEIAWSQGHHPMCLGTTAAGEPRHPLYVPGSQWFVQFRRRDVAS